MDIISNTEQEKSAKNLTTLIYALYAASFLIGITSIVAIVMNYIKKEDVAGTFFESHFRWQIRTFWFTLLWLIVYGLLIITLIGIPIAWVLIFILGLWVAYRVGRGWLALKNGELPPVSRNQ